jgi:hypothetical protein
LNRKADRKAVFGTVRTIQAAPKEGSFRGHNVPSCGKRKRAEVDPKRTSLSIAVQESFLKSEALGTNKMAPLDLSSDAICSEF